jgi:chemotaxis family two-component system sensor kinase Cph1
VVRESQPTDYAVVYDSHDHFIIELEPAASRREFHSARHFLRLYAISTVFRENEQEVLRFIDAGGFLFCSRPQVIAASC